MGSRNLLHGALGYDRGDDSSRVRRPADPADVGQVSPVGRQHRPEHGATPRRRPERATGAGGPVDLVPLALEAVVAMRGHEEGWEPIGYPRKPRHQAAEDAEGLVQAAIARDIFGNPFRPPVAFAPEWRTDTAVAIARQMYEVREFSAMPILADARQDSGCDSDDILNHCRDGSIHVRGCWVLDLVLGNV